MRRLRLEDEDGQLRRRVADQTLDTRGISVEAWRRPRMRDAMRLLREAL